MSTFGPSCIGIFFRHSASNFPSDCGERSLRDGIWFTPCFGRSARVKVGWAKTNNSALEKESCRYSNSIASGLTLELPRRSLNSLAKRHQRHYWYTVSQYRPIHEVCWFGHTHPDETLVELVQRWVNLCGRSPAGLSGNGAIITNVPSCNEGSRRKLWL